MEWYMNEIWTFKQKAPEGQRLGSKVDSEVTRLKTRQIKLDLIFLLKIFAATCFMLSLKHLCKKLLTDLEYLASYIYTVKWGT